MLDHYRHYWEDARGMGKTQRRQRQRQIRERVSGTWGSAGDPLGAQTPAAQNQLLENLGKIAAGRIDDWESLVDPTLSYGENKAILKQNGADDFHTEKLAERRKWKADIPDREKKHARKKIRENYQEIQENPGNHPIVQDIAAEYGEEFVASQLERIAIDTVDPDATDAPLITENTPEPSAADSSPDPFRIPDRVPTDYPGLLGAVRLFLAYWLTTIRTQYLPVAADAAALAGLWVRWVATRARLETQDRVATARVWGAYGVRRLTAEPSDSPLVATPEATYSSSR